MAAKNSHDDDDDFVEDADIWNDEDDDLKDVEAAPVTSSNRSQRTRDWRDMERYKEELELKRLMQDDYLFDDDERSWRQ